jgi:hypothetical protein
MPVFRGRPEIISMTRVGGGMAMTRLPYHASHGKLFLGDGCGNGVPFL